MKKIAILLGVLLLAGKAVSGDGIRDIVETINPGAFWVELEIPNNEDGLPKLAILDPGAFQTMLPLSLIAAANGRPVDVPIKIQGSSSGEVDAAWYIIPALAIDGCVLRDLRVIGVPDTKIGILMVGIPTLELLDAKFEMRARRATFVCPGTGETHTVLSPNGRLKTSRLWSTEGLAAFSIDRQL